MLNLRARVTGPTPCERNVRDRLFAFYDWCAQNDGISDLANLAKTVSRWEDQIVAAVLTGATNATSENLNRLAKLEAPWPTDSGTRRTSADACALPAPAAHGGDAHSPQPEGEHAR